MHGAEPGALVSDAAGRPMRERGILTLNENDSY